MKLVHDFKAIFSKPQPRYLQGPRPASDRQALVEARIARKKGNTPAKQAGAYERVQLALLGGSNG